MITIKENIRMLICLFIGIFCLWGINTDFLLRWNERNPEFTIIPFYFVLFGCVFLFLSGYFLAKCYSGRTLKLYFLSYFLFVFILSLINSCNTIFLNVFVSICSFTNIMESEKEVDLTEAYIYAISIMILFNFVIFILSFVPAKIYLNKKKC